jgi:hypothetical protein
MATEASENFEGSSEDRGQSSNGEEELSSANRELMEEYDEARMKNILVLWYNVDFKHKLNFPETFNEVPAHQSANRIWRAPMDDEEVARRLLGESDNDGPNVLPAEIIRFFSEIVESASNQFADLQKQVDDNEHHIKVLERAVENGKAPNFLKLDPPKVRFFPDDAAESLQKSYRKILDEAALAMLKCTLSERHLLRAKLCKEAEKMLEDVEKEATTKWMEAQGEAWNGWDHLYRVTAEVQQGENLRRVLVPISSTTFRIAMKQCRFKVSTLMETKRLEKAEETKRLRKEQKLRKAALAQVSALPRPEAEKSIQRQMQDMMKPLIAELGSIKEQLQKNSDPPRTDRTDQLIASRKDVERGNRSAPRAADAGGAATKSARKSRTETSLDASDVEQEASSAQTGKRKRRRCPAEAKATADAPTPPSAAESGDRASDPGPIKHGKQGKRRRRKGKAEKDHE